MIGRVYVMVVTPALNIFSFFSSVKKKKKKKSVVETVGKRQKIQRQ